MLSRLRLLLVKTPIRIALGLIAAYFLFAWFGFEPLLKWAAPTYIADKSRHVLTIGAAKFDPLRLSLDLRGLKLSEPDGKPLLAFERLFVDFDAASLFKWAYTFDEILLVAPSAQLEQRADGSLNWSALLEALKSKDDEPDKPLPRLLIRKISLERGRVYAADRKVGVETTLTPLDFTLSDLSTLPDDKGAYTLAATTKLGARIRWKGDLTLNPMRANGQIGIDNVMLERLWPYVEGKLNLQPPAGNAGVALNYRFAFADKRLSLVLDQIAMNLAGLTLRGKNADHDAITLDRLALTGGRFDLEQQQLDIGAIALDGGKVDLNRDAAGKLEVMDWFVASPPPPQGGGGTSPASPQTPAKSTAKPTPAPAEKPWHINLASFSLDGFGIRLHDAGFATPLEAEIGNLKLGLKVHAEAGGAQTQVMVDDFGVALSGIRLASGKTPLFVLGGIDLSGGKLDLAAHDAQLDKIALSNGKLDLVRDAHGRIDLLDALKPLADPTHAAPAKQENAADAKATWHYRVDRVELAGFQVGARDETVQPAGGLTLQGFSASARGFSDNLKTPLAVKLGFRVKEGGTFQAEGKVVPATPSADLHLKLDALALAPAQPWLTQAANLKLDSGRVSSHGRVKYDGKAKTEQQVHFYGGFAVDDLLLKETETGDRFLAWKRLDSDTVRASPAGLDIDELKLDGLGAKLVIYADKSVNLKKILRSSTPAAPPVGEEKAAANATNPAKAPEPTVIPTVAATPKATGEKPFRLNIERVRVEHGEMDFADLSLSLPFGTRIHDLQGAFNGISSQPGALAQVELDGQVDEYGLARVVGQVDLFNPTDFMDLKAVFKNVEMANLTPYAATFAGYKLKSGKLSLDLEYKIKQRQMLGENQVIMDQLTLGERLEGPDIKHLPLELAIAILKDSDGRIDLGLPVSGSLDDPQFSYGRIIWKAISNILTKIVTAPFRALASLFGGNGDKLEQIAFEAGESALTPPEKEKFKQIAQILTKRPGLALTVHGAWSAEIDRPVLRERQLRREVAETMGLKLAPDEDAGPIATSNPKVRTALETLYAAHFGEQPWKTLQANWLKANPDQNPETGKMLSRLKGLFKPEQPLSEADQTALHGSDLYAMLYDRLLDKEQVSDDTLHHLAERREQAITTGLAAIGAPRDRIHHAAIEPYKGEGREVPVKLELGVAGKN